MNPFDKNLQNLPGADSIHRKVLPNGITILSFTNKNTYSTDIVGLMETGAAADPKEKLGLAHFAANMLSRGTEKRDFSEYHDQLESIGANLIFSCGTRHTWFRGKSLSENADTLLKLAAESLLQPAFPQEYVGRLRNQLLAGLAIREQDTSEVASMLFDRGLFPDHPYEDPVDGYPDTVESIDRDDLVNYHRDYFRPQGMILAAAGALECGTLEDLVDKYFGSWQAENAKRVNIPPVPAAPSEIIRKHKGVEEKSQTDLVIGTLGPSRISEDYLPVYIGNNILGQFGLMGRIGESVRTKSGLAYHASSSVNGWQEAGTWEFSAGLNPGNLDRVIELIRDEIRKFTEEPVSEAELMDTISHLIGRLPLSLESNAGIANAILKIERFNLGLDYFQRYPDMVKSISAQEILESSRKYLHPDKLVVASAGAGKDIE